MTGGPLFLLSRSSLTTSAKYVILPETTLEGLEVVIGGSREYYG
jgi:hypothetical protein